jgi:hypothetical protein
MTFVPSHPSTFPTRLVRARPARGIPGRGSTPVRDHQETRSMTACLSTIESATRDTIGARRNALIGLWAGRRMGLADDALAAYVAEVMASDHEKPGVDDLVSKIWTDFDAAGVPVSTTEIIIELSRTERSVRAELLSTD